MPEGSGGRWTPPPAAVVRAIAAKPSASQLSGFQQLIFYNVCGPFGLILLRYCLC